MMNSCLLPLAIVIGIVLLIASSSQAGEMLLFIIVMPPYLLWKHRREIAKAIWGIHHALGVVLVRVIRDLPLAVLWNDQWGAHAIRVAYLFWMACPVLLALPLGLSGLRHSVWFALAIPSIVLIVCGYYHEFLHGQIRHRRWPRFIREYYLMRAKRQMATRVKTVRMS